jgi:large subunit ribosomal protein L34e
MPHKFKSRTFTRIKVKTAKGVTTHYKKPKPAKAKCADCGKVLAGVPNERPVKMMNMPKTAKRPERPYGGKLCSKCMRKTIIERVRK